MPIKWSSSNTAVSTFGIGIAALGILWENLFGPSWLGWTAIIAGTALVLFIEKPRSTPLKWPLVILVIMAGVSLLVSADPHLTHPQVTRLLAGITGFIALVTWARNRQRLLLASFILILGGALIALLAPVIVRWNLAKGVPIPDIIYQSFSLLFADAVHPNVMASIMVLLIPLPAAFLFLSFRRGPWPLSTRWAPLLLTTTLALMSFILLLTKSRGGYVAGAVGVLAVLWFSRYRLLALILTLITTGTGIWLISNGEQQASTVAGELADAGTLAFRLQVWRVASWMLSDFPFTGVGMGSFNVVATRLYPLPDVADPGAHNLYLQIGVDLGLPGLIAFAAILLLTMYMVIISVKHTEPQADSALRALSVGLFAGVIAHLFHGLVDITIWGTRVSFLPWLIIALVTAVYLFTAENHSAVE